MKEKAEQLKKTNVLHIDGVNGSYVPTQDEIQKNV